ncbi:hypothetical protein EDD22DRAFT_849118 [Suillus occidentalis]|nr:hypothetical protein EDD22DRAFT_849118 [Suillus occidentalis]
MNSRHASPLSSTRGTHPDYSRKGITEGSFDSALTLDRAPSHRHVSRMKHSKSKHSSSSPSDSYGSISGDDINAPLSPPSILRHLSDYARLAKQRPKPYQRGGSTLAERLVGGHFIGHRGSKNQPNVSKNKDVLEHTLKNLSSEARTQAVVTQHAEVEWRRLCALTTAWRIEAMEQHSKLLHMVLEREAEVYANAASEPLNTSMKELVNCTTKEELEDQKECTIAVYDDDTTSFAEADAELDHMETFVCRYWLGHSSAQGHTLMALVGSLITFVMHVVSRRREAPLHKVLKFRSSVEVRLRQNFVELLLVDWSDWAMTEFGQSDPGSDSGVKEP